MTVAKPLPSSALGAAEGDRVLRCWGVADDGAVVAVSVPRPVAHLLAARWPPQGLARVDQAPQSAHRVLAVTINWITGETVAVIDGVESLGSWERVESDLALFAAERLSGLVAVHAAAILLGGRVLLVPGASGVGKSTLCVAAANVGATVLSDEYALVDPASGWVTGWQRSVRMRRQDGGVDLLDLAVASEAAPVGVVALVVHQPGEVEQWTAIAGADVVLGLLANTVCATLRADESLDAALAIARSARAVGGPRGEAASAIVELLALLAAPYGV